MSDQAVATPLAGGDEEAIRTSEKRFKVVAIVAAALLAPQVIGQIVVLFMTVPTFAEMYASQGAELPLMTSLLVRFAPVFLVALLAIDAAIFWGFYKLAKRYWIGLLFAPLFAQGIVTGLVVWMLYLPMYQIVTIVQ